MRLVQFRSFFYAADIGALTGHVESGRAWLLLLLLRALLLLMQFIMQSHNYTNKHAKQWDQKCLSSYQLQLLVQWFQGQGIGYDCVVEGKKVM